MIKKFLIFSAVFLFWEQTDAQQLKSFAEHDIVSEDQKTDFHKTDIITPVLQREFTDAHKNNINSSGLRNRSEVVFFSSAILPGSGQAMNENWIKSSVFLAIEAVSIFYMIDFKNRGRRGERNYENWADENWSVVQYSNWLVEYHDVNGIDNPYLNELREMVDGVNATFNTNTDWQQVNLDVLRNVERNTPYITTDDAQTRNFSHVLPNYGSQQYYELIAKYYQYQAGWRDYNEYHNSLGHTVNQMNERYLIDPDGLYASPFFFEGAQRAEQFNNDYRMGRHFTSLLVLNHVFSAFDAYFTLKIRQNRLQASTGVTPDQYLKLSFSF